VTERRARLGALAAIGRFVRPRRWRLVGLTGLLVAYALLWVLEAHATNGAHTQLLGIAVTIPALLVLIAGGNLLQDWMGVRHRPPQFAEPRRDALANRAPSEEGTEAVDEDASP